MLGTEKRIGTFGSAGAVLRFSMVRTVVAAGLLIAGGALGGQLALAQQADEQAAQQAEQRADQGNGPREDIVVAQAGSPLNARRAVIEGIKSFEAGKHADAVTSLSIALQGEGLTAKDTAKALYYRGRSYKQLKKFPEAIADLTSAMWLKDGLSDAERQRAEADRKASYAGVGVASPATVARSKTAAPSAASAAAAPAPASVRTKTAPPREIAVPVKPVEVAQPARKTAAAPVPAASAGSNWTTSVGANTGSTGASAAQAPTRTAALSSGGRGGVYVPDSNSDGMVGFPAGTAVTGGASATAAAAPAPAAPAPSTTAATSPSSNPFQQVGQQVGSFFSNMTSAITGGGSAGSANTAKPAPESTASTAASSDGAVTAVSAWNSGTQVAANSPAASAAPSRAAAEPVRKTAALAPAQAAARPAAAAPRPAATGKAGKYRLQLAAVRSRNEAERLARDLASQYRSALGSYSPEIDETVYGNMGTFYRVQVGPFASVAEPQSLCTKIKSSGFDCLITGK